ncbi:hypothetical protein [Lysobacter fragariae]
MNRRPLCLLGLLLAFAATAQAQQVTTHEPNAADEQTTPTTDEQNQPSQDQAKSKRSDVRDHHCLQYTGTLIRPRGDRKNRDCIWTSGRVYTQEDIQRTGAFSVSEALRMLDPSIY